MLRTKLFEEHKKLKGQIVPFAGWELPVQYTSIKEEVAAVRNSCGIFDVSHMGEFFVEGDDASKFVDYLVTNDIENTPSGKAVYSPLLNDSGKCIDDLIVYNINKNKILICVNASNIDKDWNWINSIYQRTKSKFNVKIENQSNNFSLLAVQGPKSHEILEKVLSLDLSAMEYYSVIHKKIESRDMYIARTGYTGEDGFEIFVQNEDVVNLWNKLIAKDIKPCGLGARDCLRIEVGYPLYGHELSENLTPLDVGLKWTVKFKKASFVGKEALEKYIPKLKQIKFYSSKGIPRDGYDLKLSSNEIIGKVTSGTLSPTINRGIGLGLINSDIPATENIYVDIRGQLIPIEITTSAFVKGGHK